MSATPPPDQPTPETSAKAAPATTQTIVIQPPPPGAGRRALVRLLLVALLASVVLNAGQYFSYREYFSESSPPHEKFHSGDANVSQKIALLRMSTTIMPPFTERLLKSIKRAKEDDSVKGVVLVIDSPGGFVADSHQIYHRLRELSSAKPMVVAMQRMAASGGYYIAMGAGPDATIYVEPTTWTGSIGVIIPRYNATELAHKIGVSAEPLKTGKFKDSLSPFRPLREDETQLWRDIMYDSYEQFLDVIATNRKGFYRRDKRYYGLGASLQCAMLSQWSPQPGIAVEEVATGQVFTAKQALKLGLADQVGFVDDAIADLQERLQLKTARVITYQHPETLLSMLAGSMKANQPERRWQALMNAAVPRAMYYCTGLPLITVREVPN